MRGIKARTTTTTGGNSDWDVLVCQWLVVRRSVSLVVWNCELILLNRPTRTHANSTVIIYVVYMISLFSAKWDGGNEVAKHPRQSCLLWVWSVRKCIYCQCYAILFSLLWPVLWSSSSPVVGSHPFCLSIKYSRGVVPDQFLISNYCITIVLALWLRGGGRWGQYTIIIIFLPSTSESPALNKLVLVIQFVIQSPIFPFTMASAAATWPGWVSCPSTLTKTQSPVSHLQPLFLITFQRLMSSRGIEHELCVSSNRVQAVSGGWLL